VKSGRWRISCRGIHAPGARLSHGCVQHLPSERQGEIDVIGVANAPYGVKVWVAEVAIHLNSLDYGGYGVTVERVSSKVDAARAYVAQVYRDVTPTVELWSPVVPLGLLSALASVDVDLIVNEGFTSRLNELASLASSHTKLTGDDAYRFLELLTHLRGDRPQFGAAKLGKAWLPRRNRCCRCMSDVTCSP
jgi:hypothetical protein